MLRSTVMTPSYAKGPDLGLLELTTHQLLDRTVARFGDREALVSRHQGIRLTWRELATRVEETARGLAGLGLEPGDRVGVWSTNCAEWIYLHLGIAQAGMVQVNVNPAYRPHELAYVLRKSGMKALILRASDHRIGPHRRRGGDDARFRATRWRSSRRRRRPDLLGRRRLRSRRGRIRPDCGR